MSLNGRPGVFLDRDGVINIDHGYVHRQQDFVFVDGVFELCRAAKQRALPLLVVTNQAGIGRGYYGEEDFWSLTRWMVDVFAREGVVIDQVYFCPTHPEHGVGAYKVDSEFRKPGPGMILQGAMDHDVALERAMLVGDKESDIQAGMRAGVGCNVLYRPSGGQESRRTDAHHVVSDLREAIALLPH